MSQIADENLKTMSITPNKIVDAKGLLCPEPIMMLHGAVRDSQVGDIVQVVATDPSTKRDIRQFCEFLGHELLAVSEASGCLEFFVRKAK